MTHTDVSAPKTVEVNYDLNGNTVLDDGETFYFYVKFAGSDAAFSGVMNNGASVRLSSTSSGLRFTTVFSKAVVDALNAKGQVTYGTLIVPTSYLANANAFTKEALEAAGLKYMNIVAQDGIIYNADGTVTIRAAITNLLVKNYDRSFSAVCYAYVDGTYYYSAYNTASNARTLEDVSIEALEDLSTEKGEKNGKNYANEVTVNGITAYSPYTAAQRKMLEKYNAVTYGTPVLEDVDFELVRSADNSFEYYSNSATVNNYNDYKALLVGNGYTRFNEKVMDGNSFATYTGNGKVLTLSYTPNTTTLTLVVESADNTSLPTTESENAGYATGTTATVTQVGQWYVDTTVTEGKCYGVNSTWGKNAEFANSYSAGMSYVIRLSDGSFIIVDGGYGTDTHVANLYNVLAEQAADPDNIVIAAWVFTHAHSDHAGILEPFTKAHGSKVTVERFIFNFPTDEAASLSGSACPTNAIKDAMLKYKDAKITIAHAGQEFFIRNAKINILFTHELMAPHSLNYYNSCSMVFNVELAGKKLLFFGDAGGDNAHGGSKMAYINNIYTATTLKSDFVQLAHHGVDKDIDPNGVKLYEMYKNKVQPTYVFVPSASEYVLVDGDYIRLSEQNGNYIWKSISSANRFVAGSTVLVVTLDGGNVSTQSYANVDAYIAA